LHKAIRERTREKLASGRLTLLSKSSKASAVPVAMHISLTCCCGTFTRRKVSLSSGLFTSSTEKAYLFWEEWLSRRTKDFPGAEARSHPEVFG